MPSEEDRYCERVDIRSRLRLQIDEYLVCFDLDREARMSDRRVSLMLAGFDVELPTVPWASQDATLKPPLAQGASLVRADAVKSMKLSRDVEQRYDSIARD